MKIFRDRFGKLWIHGSGVRLYFRRKVPVYKFYDYDKIFVGQNKLRTVNDYEIFATPLQRNLRLENFLSL